MADKDIIRFIELLNLCLREKDPPVWLSTSLNEENISWVEPLTATDDPAASKKPGPRSGDASHERTAPGVPPEAAPDENDMARQAYRKALGAVGRKAYSNALGQMAKIGGEITGQKRPGVKKSKRAIQDMIALLNEDESILLGISTLRDYDDYTFTHSVNVAILAMCLGKRLGLSKLYLEYLGLCALFHDLGKLDVPIELIRKPGGFTDEEFAVIKTHPLYSVRHIIQFNASPAMKAKILLPPFEHHLAADLSGYPQTGRQAPISLLGRILAIADQYDAMNSSRAYRLDPISPERSLQIMIDLAGSKIDPLLLKVFINMVGVYPIGTLLLLDTEETALVMEVPEKAEEGRPIVRLLIRTEEDKLLGGEVVDLAEREPSGAFKRNVLRCFHPSEYGIQPADILIP
jgi:HD-GYP domain-containing protein (c-di-GMP phosphodiesterase class II)